MNIGLVFDQWTYYKTLPANIPISMHRLPEVFFSLSLEENFIQGQDCPIQLLFEVFCGKTHQRKPPLSFWHGISNLVLQNEHCSFLWSMNRSPYLTSQYKQNKHHLPEGCGIIHSNARSSRSVFCHVTHCGGQQKKPPLVLYQF